MILEILKECKNDMERARMIELLIVQNTKIEWDKIITKYPKLPWTKYSIDPKNDRYVKNEGFSKLSRELNNIRILKDKDLKEIINTLYETNYKYLKRLIAKDDCLLNYLSLNNFRSYLRNENKKEIDIKIINSLDKKHINVIVSEGLCLKQKRIKKKQDFIYNSNSGVITGRTRGGKSYLSGLHTLTDNLFYYVYKGGIINNDILNYIFKSSFYDIKTNKNKKYIIGTIDEILKSKKIKSHLKYLSKDIELSLRFLERIIYLDDKNVNNVKILKNILIEYSKYPVFRKKYSFASGILLCEDESVFIKENGNLSKFINNKGVLRELERCTFKNNFIYLDSFRFCYIIKKEFPEMDEQLLYPLIKPYHSNFEYLDISYEKVERFVSFFKDYLKLKKIIHLINKEFFNENFDHNVNDIIRMRDIIENKTERKLILPKFKKLKQLHDWLSIESSKLRQKNFNLNQGLDKLENYNLGDGIYVKVPKYSHDLIAVGTILKHCVGNGGYAEDALLGESKIITLFKEDKLWACLEYKEGVFFQKKGLLNENIELDKDKEEKLLNEINNLL